MSAENAETTITAAADNPNVKWYKKTYLIIWLIILFPPAGTVLMFKYAEWKPLVKRFVAFAALCALLFDIVLYVTLPEMLILAAIVYYIVYVNANLEEIERKAKARKQRNKEIEERKQVAWYKKTYLIIWLIFLFPLAGVVLMFKYAEWEPLVKRLVTFVALCVLLLEVALYARLPWLFIVTALACYMIYSHANLDETVRKIEERKQAEWARIKTSSPFALARRKELYTGDNRERFAWAVAKKAKVNGINENNFTGSFISLKDPRVNYAASLFECSCPYYKKRYTPCEHMYSLALHFGMIAPTDDFWGIPDNISKAIDKAGYWFIYKYLKIHEYPESEIFDNTYDNDYADRCVELGLLEDEELWGGDLFEIMDKKYNKAEIVDFVNESEEYNKPNIKGKKANILQWLVTYDSEMLTENILSDYKKYYPSPELISCYNEVYQKYVAGKTKNGYLLNYTAFESTKQNLSFAPDCPGCGRPMEMRTGVHGPFWGCVQFPYCRCTRDIDDI